MLVLAFGHLLLALMFSWALVVEEKSPGTVGVTLARQAPVTVGPAHVAREAFGLRRLIADFSRRQQTHIPKSGAEDARTPNASRVPMPFAGSQFRRPFGIYFTTL